MSYTKYIQYDPLRMATDQAVFACEFNQDSRVTTDQAVFACEEDVHGADHAIAKDERETQANKRNILFVNWKVQGVFFNWPPPCSVPKRK